VRRVGPIIEPPVRLFQRGWSRGCEPANINAGMRPTFYTLGEALNLAQIIEHRE
jgi:hypothetical protein